MEHLLEYVMLAHSLKPGYCKLYLLEALWFPGTAPVAVGILSPVTENWPDVVGAVPKKEEEDQVGGM